MASLGTVFVELQLDRSKFNASLQTLERDATSVPLQIEKSFSNLGIKSSYQFDLMRQKAEINFEAIRSRSESTANDIVRAEQAKVAQIAALNEQQFGKHTTLLDTLKTNWIAASAAIVAAWMAVNKAMEFVELGAKAEQAAESFRLVAESSGIAADALLANLDRAAAGTMDDSDIMQQAVKGMVLGLSDAQLVKIMDAARIAARYMGTDVKTAFDDITRAIGTDMPRALKQYGLITREETKQIQAAIAAGATDVSLYALAMAHAAVNSAKFGEAQANAAEKVQIFKAVVNEAKEGLGKMAISLMNYVAAGGLWLDELSKRSQADWAKQLGFFAEAKALEDAAAERMKQRGILLETVTPAATGKEDPSGKSKAIEDAEKALKLEQDRIKAAAARTETKPKERQDAYYESVKAQAAVLAEVDVLSAKFLMDEAKREEDAAKKRVELAYSDAKQQLQITLDEATIKREAWEAYYKYLEDEEKKRIGASKADYENVKTLAEWNARVQQEADAEVTKFLEGEEAKRVAILSKQRADLESMFAPISSAISGTLQGILQGTQTVEEGFRRMGQNIAASLFENIVQKGLKRISDYLVDFLMSLSSSQGAGAGIAGVIASLFSAVGSGASGMAEGGYATAGTPYIVGERGPELFVPGQSGTVVPNGSGGGGSSRAPTNIYIDARKAERGVSTEIMGAIQTGMNQAVKISLARTTDERRRGGMRGLDR